MNSDFTRLRRAHLLVQGQVQGVGFRAFVQSHAVRRALKGWVKNLPDGQVESEVEGDEALVNEFIRTVRRGPPLARVQNVDLEWINPHARDSSFEIMY